MNFTVGVFGTTNIGFRMYSCGICGSLESESSGSNLNFTIYEIYNFSVNFSPSLSPQFPHLSNGDDITCFKCLLCELMR